MNFTLHNRDSSSQNLDIMTFCSMLFRYGLFMVIGFFRKNVVLFFINENRLSYEVSFISALWTESESWKRLHCN